MITLGAALALSLSQTPGIPPEWKEPELFDSKTFPVTVSVRWLLPKAVCRP